MKKVSVVILNWNGKSLLEKFLPSVVSYTPTNIAEIIVADNCSEDDSVNFINTNYPNVRQILLPENYGYAQGYNEALDKIDTKYAVLLNSDVEVSPNWLEPVINYLEQNQNVTAVQPKILSQRQKESFEYAGACGGFIDKYGYPFCRGRIFGKVEKDVNQYDSPKEIFWASGACMFIRLDEFKNLGGFDSTFFAHMEEIDLCWRINARGKKIVCFPQSIVYHVGAATLSEESPRKTFLNFRNNLLMLFKNLPEKDLRKIISIRLFLDYLATLQMFLFGRVRNARAVLEAHKEFKKTKNNYIEKRKENLKKSTQPSIPTIYKKSILWAFYTKGCTTFEKLNWQ